LKMPQNKAVIFASHPEGLPKPTDFRVEERPFPQQFDEGCIQIKLLYISVDPYMRGRMRKETSLFYSQGFKLEEPFNGGCLAEVLESKSKDYVAGDLIVGMLPWIAYQVLQPSQFAGVRKWKPIEGIPNSTSIGALGMPGMTAFFGLLEIARPKEGETVVVSGAAGAVGSLVGQIAKIKGCRVVGIAGSEEKEFIMKSKYHFDETLNYKKLDTLEKMNEGLKKACPRGIDVYFDNTGGYTSDAVMLNLNNFARISVCGAIDIYNEHDLLTVQGPKTDYILIIKQARKEGFLVFRWTDRYNEGIKQMAEWIKQEKLTFDETVVEGIENCGKAFIDMMTGKNVGKMIIKC